jgi:hypothetical protein
LTRSSTTKGGVGDDFDLAGRHVRVDGVGGPRRNRADYPDHVFLGELLARLSQCVSEQHLRPSLTVTQIDEHDPAKVAATADPSHELHPPADVGGPQTAAERPFPRSHQPIAHAAPLALRHRRTRF